MISKQTLLFLAVIILVAGAGYFFLNRSDLVPATAEAPAQQAPAEAPITQDATPEAADGTPADSATDASDNAAETAPPAPPITPATPNPNCTQFSLRAGEWVCTGDDG